MGYLNDMKDRLVPQFTFISHINNMDNSVPHIYVDGSYDTQQQIAGFGFVVVYHDEVIYQHNNYVDDSAYGSRNITGECASAIFALKWADKQKYNKVIIIFDYLGIGMWAAGHWQARAPIALKYKELLKKIKTKAEFRHVKGHSGNIYNEMADKEAEAGKSGKKYKI
jgi:ribonuclease H-related protein